MSKIQEIAKLAGVSTATVSRVFSHHPNVKDDVRERVFAAARKNGYRPRLSARQRNIALISPYKAVYPIQSYVEMVTSELIHELSLRDYRIEILPLDNLKQLPRIQFCGAVGIGTDGSLFQNWEEQFAAPLIIVDRDAPKGASEIYSVRSDEEQAMELAVAHLHGSGCRRIGCIVYGQEGIGNTEIRRDGIRKALRKFGLPVSDSLLRFSLDEGYVEEVGKLLRAGVDALFCPGGNAGMATAYALSLFGKRVPADISLIASERTVFSRYAIPPQTAISQNYTALASAVADALDARLSGQPFPRRTLIPYKLIRRDSVRSPQA